MVDKKLKTLKPLKNVSSKLLTLKNLKEKDDMRSGCLTPENGKEYDYSKGEPKYYTAYKVDYEQLRESAREWVQKLEKHEDETKLWENSHACCEHSDYHCESKPIVEWIKYFFNLDLED